eukprot:scaffold6370_cov78-Skeletonema_dohrnii-CCMP3373.AAC.3
MKQATPEKRALQIQKEEEDVAALIYQESQFRKREAEAAAAIKKGSHSDISRRRSSRIASTAITAARDAKLIATVKKEATAKSRKRLCSEEDDVVPKKVSKLCSTDRCTNIARGGGGVCHRHGAKRVLCSTVGCTNLSSKGGVCKRHGNKVKVCNADGCTNQSVKG